MDTLNIKKYFYQILSIFAALLLAFSIAQIPVQAAAKPGTDIRLQISGQKDT